MIERNLSDLLVKFGIDKNISDKLEDTINGNDYQNLINYLSGNNLDIVSANSILKKYNVQIPLNNITESKNKNYCYSIKIRRNLKDKLIDYLEANHIDFKNDDLTFDIDIKDKNLAYKIDRFLSKIKQPKMESVKVSKFRKKLKESTSNLVSPEVISIGSLAGIDMKHIREAFDEIEYSDDTNDYDFYDDDSTNDIEIEDIDDENNDDITFSDEIEVTEEDDVFVSIQNSIADIENNLGNLKLTDYKMVIDSLSNLLDIARQSGRDYLGD